MNKILRIGYNRYYSDAVFEEHLEFIKKNVDKIDGIVVFAEFSHYGYWSLEYSAENAALLKKRIAAYREAGVKRIGINLLCIVGHTEESWEVLPRAPFQYMVNYDGTESRSCLCPSTDEFVDYVSKRLALYAAAGADEVWIDDDLRITNHGVVRDFCYCPKCIERFNRDNGTSFTRKELVSALAKDKTVKKSWDKFKYDVMIRVFDAVKKGVHSISKDVKIGFMACDLDIKPEWLTACNASIARPGGGFWGDESPIEMFDKVFKVQRQIKLFPDNVADIQYEYESFPYEWMQRSQKISELESSLVLMSGCNGILFSGDIFNDKQATVDMIEKNTKKWDVLNAYNEGCKPIGVFCASPENSTRLGELSIPTTPYLENACAAMVLGDEFDAFTDAQIEAILDKNLLTDGKGLEILHTRGFGDRLGGKVASVRNSGMAQRFGDDELNGEYKNYYRDVFMNFVFGSYGLDSFAYELAPSEKAKAVSYLERVTHQPDGVSAYKYEENGKKIFCDGYLFLEKAKTNAKRAQLINVLNWLSDGKLPIKVNKAAKVIPIVTSNGDGVLNIMLSNASFDATGEFEIEISCADTFSLITDDGTLAGAKQRTENGKTVLTLENIEAWGYVLLTNQ